MWYITSGKELKSVTEKIMMRLDKYLSDATAHSRREIRNLVKRKAITVNGAVAKCADMKINEAHDAVCVDGELIVYRKFIYLMLNKPQGYVTTMSDEQSRPCVASLVADVGKRVYPVGRLDMDSEGMLIFTDDGEFANLMMHPSSEVKKIYHVKVDREITPEERKTLSSPMEIDGYTIAPADIEIISRKNGQTLMRIAIIEGRNRQIRKMCESLELEVLSLKRVQIGDLKMGDLRPGKWRYLSLEQVNSLALEGYPMHCLIFTHPWSLPIRCHSHSSYDNQKYLRTLPNVP